MDAYESINKILVHLFNDIWGLEEKAVITEEFKDLTNNDMHIIEAVGLGDGNNMSTIAKKLGITVGSLTTSMNSLVNKKYAVRHRSEEDRRIVNIKLTEKGEKAYHHHAEFHRKMVEAVVETLDEEEIPVLTKALDNLYNLRRITVKVRNPLSLFDKKSWQRIFGLHENGMLSGKLQLTGIAEIFWILRLHVDTV